MFLLSNYAQQGRPVLSCYICCCCKLIYSSPDTRRFHALQPAAGLRSSMTRDIGSVTDILERGNGFNGKDTLSRVLAVTDWWTGTQQHIQDPQRNTHHDLLLSLSMKTDSHDHFTITWSVESGVSVGTAARVYSPWPRLYIAVAVLIITSQLPAKKFSRVISHPAVWHAATRPLLPGVIVVWLIGHFVTCYSCDIKTVQACHTSLFVLAYIYIYMYWLTLCLHHVSKNAPPLGCYNFDTCEWILIFFWQKCYR